MPNCRLCGAEIFFGVNEETGKRVPLVAKELPHVYEVLDPSGTEIVVRKATVYRSHFLDCPEYHKRRKERAPRGERRMG